MGGLKGGLMHGRMRGRMGSRMGGRMGGRLFQLTFRDCHCYQLVHFRAEEAQCTSGDQRNRTGIAERLASKVRKLW
jgi:hypothetical protein